MMPLAPAGASVPVPPAHHGHCLARAAVRDEMTLPSQPSALPAARARAQRILSEWGFGPQLSEDVAVCLSELVTNAVQASAVLRPVAPVHVGLARERCWLLLAVADASPPCEASALAQHRGANHVMGSVIHQGSHRREETDNAPREAGDTSQLPTTPDSGG
jgi:hypothetical protein